MPTCTQAAPLTQRAIFSQGPALFVLGGGQLLRGRRLLDELAALSGVSGLWWRHVGGIAPKGGLALAHARLVEALEHAARSAHGQRARAGEPTAELHGDRRSPPHSASGAAPGGNNQPPPPATLELQPEEWRGLGIVGLRAEHFVKASSACASPRP